MKKQIVTYQPGFLLFPVLLPFCNPQTTLFGERIWLSFGLLCLALVYQWSRAPSLKFHIGITDLLVFLFYLWAILVSFFLNPRILSTERLIFWHLLLVYYILLRSIPQNTYKSSLYQGIYLSGIIQAGIGWLQYTDIFTSGHILFPVTGSFPNPAPFGAYMGITLLFSIDYIVRAYRKKKTFPMIINLTILLFVTILFVISFSRAAWFACIPALLYWGKERKMLTLRRVLYLVPLLCLLILPLYSLKKQSANGRLFIWKTGYEMFKEAPVTGKGGQSFEAGYMYAQSHYLQSHPESQFTFHASNNHLAFNEGLRIGVEFGLVGILILLVLIIRLFRTSGTGMHLILMLYLLTFSCFSYPGEIPALAALFVVCLAQEEKKPLFYYQTPGRIKRSLVCLLTIIFWGTTHLYIEIRKFSGELLTEEETIKKAYRYRNRSHSFLYHYNRGFILSGAKFFYEAQLYPEAIPYLEKAARFYPSNEILYDLGNSYFRTDRPMEAEKSYQTAIHMTPSHVLPYYYLFRLYVHQNDRKAEELGKEILERTYKLEGSVVLSVKDRVRRTLPLIGKEVHM